MARLSDPVTILRGVGPARAKQFENLNIRTLEDLICHFPRGYEDRTRLVTIDKLQVDVPACFRAMVMNTPRTAHVRKGLDITKVQVADHTARLSLTFFNSRYVSENLHYGQEYIFYGAVPRTAREMYEHTKNVNAYYFGEIGVEADNEGDILECRRRGFERLEQQPDFLKNAVFDGSWDESWTLRKLLRRFIWHDRLHARAMVRMVKRTFR